MFIMDNRFSAVARLNEINIKGVSDINVGVRDSAQMAEVEAS